MPFHASYEYLVLFRFWLLIQNCICCPSFNWFHWNKRTDEMHYISYKSEYPTKVNIIILPPTKSYWFFTNKKITKSYWIFTKLYWIFTNFFSLKKNKKYETILNLYQIIIMVRLVFLLCLVGVLGRCLRAFCMTV